jgi:hypothetical protein
VWKLAVIFEVYPISDRVEYIIKSFRPIGQDNRDGSVAKNLDKYAQDSLCSGSQQSLLRQTKQSMNALFLTDDI